MERTTFETSRALEFFSEKELSMQLGVSRDRWIPAIVKEMLDNGLDACETAGTLPEVTVEIGPDFVTISDTRKLRVTDGQGLRGQIRRLNEPIRGFVRFEGYSGR